MGWPTPPQKLVRHFQTTQAADFGMQPYFDPTKKKTFKNNGRRPLTKQNMEEDLKKMRIEDDLIFFFLN